MNNIIIFLKDSGIILLKQFVIFTLLNLIYVILGCLKDIFRQKGSKKQSSITSAICYGWYVLVLKSIQQVNYGVAVVGTMLSNMVGDVMGRTIADKIRPRPITYFEITLDDTAEQKPIIKNLIKYAKSLDLSGKWHEDFGINQKNYITIIIYTKTNDEDNAIFSFINKYQLKHYRRSEA